MAAQRLGHGRAVAMAGDADEADDFLLFQLLDGGENAVRAADALEVVEVAQAMDLNQIYIVRLQEFEARFNRAKRAVAVSGIDLGCQEDFLAALFRKLPEAFFAQSLQRPPRVVPRCRSS